MELEEAKKILDNLKNVLGTGMCMFGNTIDMNKDTGYIEAIETVLKALENSIDKETIKSKIEELNKHKMDIVTSLIHNTDEKLEMLKRNQIKIKIFKELLEEK